MLSYSTVVGIWGLNGKIDVHYSLCRFPLVLIWCRLSPKRVRRTAKNTQASAEERNWQAVKQGRDIRQICSWSSLASTMGKKKCESGRIRGNNGEIQLCLNNCFTTVFQTLLTVWITINCGKFWKRWEYQTTWPASWETYIQIRKQQLELDMQQQTGSK